LLPLVLLAACSAAEPRPEAAVPGPVPAAWPALALVETGDVPLWFELAPGGPELIHSPESASLEPFVPWPHARFAVDMLAWEDTLVMAVNLDGFLVMGPAEVDPGSAHNANLLLRRVSSGGHWAPYTVGSLFFWRGTPAALLYRNDFFAELYPVSPQPQVFALDASSPVPLGAEIPALSGAPPDGSWEAESLRQGPSGYWYYRVRERGGQRNQTSYFRARSLEGEGERISLAQWRNSEIPLGPQRIPPVLAAMIDGISSLNPGGGEGGPALRLQVVSPEFEGPRVFSSAPPAFDGEPLPRLYGFFREGQKPLALLVFPDGRGLYSRGAEARPFSLPPLPQGFVYTGIAAVGDSVVALWEEQDGAGIGAAGFMLFRPRRRE